MSLDSLEFLKEKKTKMNRSLNKSTHAHEMMMQTKQQALVLFSLMFEMGVQTICKSIHNTNHTCKDSRKKFEPEDFRASN
jgi:hypothetical protein